MKPALFDYQAPVTLHEAIDLLASNPVAFVIAGGQSLMPVLALRLATPSLLVDLRRLPGLGNIAVGDDGFRLILLFFAPAPDSETGAEVSRRVVPDARVEGREERAHGLDYEQAFIILAGVCDDGLIAPNPLVLVSDRFLFLYRISYLIQQTFAGREPVANALVDIVYARLDPRIRPA